VTLHKSGGGVFEITVDGKLAYSKKASGRFPTDAEVSATVGCVKTNSVGNGPESSCEIADLGGGGGSHAIIR
jgi:hypothetical protein